MKKITVNSDKKDAFISELETCAIILELRNENIMRCEDIWLEYKSAPENENKVFSKDYIYSFKWNYAIYH